MPSLGEDRGDGATLDWASPGICVMLLETSRPCLFQWDARRVSHICQLDREIHDIEHHGHAGACIFISNGNGALRHLGTSIVHVDRDDDQPYAGSSGLAEFACPRS